MNEFTRKDFPKKVNIWTQECERDDISIKTEGEKVLIIIKSNKWERTEAVDGTPVTITRTWQCWNSRNRLPRFTRDRILEDMGYQCIKDEQANERESLRYWLNHSASL